MAVDIEKLEDSPHLLDLLIKMEDVLDTFDVYVFKNWFSGEVVEGPKVRRYWLDMTLKYPYNKMPDPRAGLRLLKHGVRVDFNKVEADGRSAEEIEDERDGEEIEDGDKQEHTDKFWLVRVSIPRRLIEEMNAGELDYYEDEVDVDDVQDANDSGMSEETGITDTPGGPVPQDDNGDVPAEGEEGEGDLGAEPAPKGAPK